MKLREDKARFPRIAFISYLEKFYILFFYLSLLLKIWYTIEYTLAKTIRDYTIIKMKSTKTYSKA
jgi:hypothetical protein